MYSPKIKDELVKSLYQLKLQTRTPMTKLVNEAVVEYLKGEEQMDYIKLGIKILDKVVRVIKKELIDKEKKKTDEKNTSGDSDTGR